MRYWSPIDTHVHLRWEEYPADPFLPWGLDDAQAAGLLALMEMPNTTPPLTSAAAVERRCATVDARWYGPGRIPAHYVHLGLTSRLDQLVAAMQYLGSGPPRCRSAKWYTCHSTGEMGLLVQRTQANVWQAAAEAGYTGPIVVHAESANAFGMPTRAEREAAGALAARLPMEYTPDNPISHSLYQTALAEVDAVARQIQYAHDAGFTGTLVVAHVSTPDTVELVEAERPRRAFEIACEVTWHHLCLNWSDYAAHGNRVKVNPPLRRPAVQARLWEYALAGRVDLLGSDHAPHPLARKDDPVRPASGLPALPFWPRGIELLRRDGITEARLDMLIWENANRIFDLHLAPVAVDVAYDPGRWARYGFNPFARLG